MDTNEKNAILNGKKVVCTVLKCDQKTSPKSTYYVLQLEAFDVVEGLSPEPFECNSFQPCEAGKTYPFTFEISKKGALGAKRPQSSEEERAARRAKEAAEKAAYEADEAARGNTQPQSPQEPAATIIKPSSRDHSLAAQYGYTPQQVAIMEANKIIPPGTPVQQISYFFEVAKARGLSPILKQIYLLPFKSWNPDLRREEIGYAIIVGIDGMRMLADKSGEFLGFSDTLIDGVSIAEWLKANKPPTYAKPDQNSKEMVLVSGTEPMVVTVVAKRKKGDSVIQTEAFATWHEFYPGTSGKGSQWRKMPFKMLEKCAKAAALRDLFPQALGGLYAEEEFHKQQVSQEQPKDVDYTDWTAITKAIESAQSLEDIAKIKMDNQELGNDPQFLEALDARASEITATIS